MSNPSLEITQKETNVIKPQKKIGNYILLNNIGKGTFSKVTLGYHILTNELVAIKILQKNKIQDKIDVERINREMLILKMLCHPNISQLYETLSTIHNFYIIMEYIEGGDLFEFISTNKYLSEIQSCIFFRQLISTIEYLNKLNISHRDIKPENILLDSEKKNIKLIDFGLSNFTLKNEKLKSSCGSPCYASPEMISGKPYNGITTDIWSCGIVLYCMLVGALPFDDEDIHILYQQIREGKFYLPSTLSNEGIDLLKRLLIVDPEKRISISEIKKHPWFNIDKCILYEGVILSEKKISVDYNSISDVKNKYFIDEKDVTEEDIANMIKSNVCNKYTSTYYLYRKSKKLSNDEFKERSHSANNKNYSKRGNNNNNENIKKNLHKKDNKSMNVFVINNIISTDNNSKNVAKSIINNNVNLKKNENKKEQSKSKSKPKIQKRKKNINIDTFTDTLRKLKTKISNKSYTPINKKIFSTSLNSTFSNYYPLSHNIKGVKVNKGKLNVTDNLKDRNNSNILLNSSNASGDYALKREFSHPIYKNGKIQFKKEVENKFSLVKHIFKKENAVRNNSKNSKNNYIKKKNTNLKVIYMNTVNEKIPLNLSGFTSKNNIFKIETAKRKNSPNYKNNEYNNKQIGLSRNKGKEKTKQEVLKKLYLP